MPTNPEQQARMSLVARLRSTKVNMVDAYQAANEIEALCKLVEKERIEHVQALIEGALLGTEGRRGVWTDRDYLVAVYAVLVGGDEARKLATAKPVALSEGNKPPRFADQPWWVQYYETADKLDDNFYADVQLASDDIRTLVDGLRDLERKLDEVDGPDPTGETT